MKRAIFLSILIILLIYTYGYSIKIMPPRPFVLTSHDKKFLFISIPKDYSKYSEEKSEHQEIRRKYKRGGLYKNGGSKDPLWVFDKEIDKHHVVYFDEVSLVLKFSPHNIVDDALIFCAFGNKIKSYTVNELTEDVQYKRRLDHSYNAAIVALEESWFKEIKVEEGLLKIVNRENRTLIFDIKTGNQLSENSSK